LAVRLYSDASCFAICEKLKIIFGKDEDDFDSAELDGMTLFIRLLSCLHSRTKEGSRLLLELVDGVHIMSSVVLCEGRVVAILMLTAFVSCFFS
jgi:hypothetical protein